MKIENETIIQLWEDKTEAVTLWEDLVNKSIPNLNDYDLMRISCYMNEFSKKISNGYDRLLTDGEMELVSGSLYLLSKVKDLSKIIFTKEECEDKQVKVCFESREQIEMLREWNIDAMEMAINQSLIEAGNEINRLIDEGKTIYVNNLIRNISLIAEGTNAPVLILKFNIKCI